MLDLIQWRARKTPEAKALFFNGRWYSYRELEGRANRLANRLLGLGLKRGDRVGVIAHNHLVHFDLLLAAPKIGVVFAPFNPHLDRPALVACVQQVRPALLFVDSRHHEMALVLGLPWARLSEYRDWLAVGSPELPSAPPLSVDDPHSIYSTARGAAVLPYRQVLLNARHAADTWGLSTQDCTVHCLPCYGPELNLLCLPVLYRGGRVVLMSGFDADEFLGHLALHRVTVAALSPEMLRFVVGFGDFDEADLSSLNWLASVGAPAPQGVRQILARRGLGVRLLLASAEAGPHLFHATLEDSAARPGLLGLPLPDVQLLLHDATGDATPDGQTGAAHVAGVMTFLGYLDASGSLPPQGGDPLGNGLALRMDHDGQYLYQGQAAEVFRSGGEWIYPGAIEAALLQMDGIVDCTVTGLPRGDGDSAILANIVLQEGLELTDSALAVAVAATLPAGQRPEYFQRYRALPRDAWGKVQRERLTQKFSESLPPLP